MFFLPGECPCKEEQEPEDAERWHCGVSVRTQEEMPKGWRVSSGKQIHICSHNAQQKLLSE